MGTALALRTDIGASEPRRPARRGDDGRVAVRLSAPADAPDGMSREAAARAAGMDRRTPRDRVIRFDAEGVEGLRDLPRSGRRPWPTEGGQATLKAIVPRGPDPGRDGVSAWRALDLRRIAGERFGARHREGGMPRPVRAPGLSWRKTRPSHPEADKAARARLK
jgi:transposase